MSIDREGPNDQDLSFDPTEESGYQAVSDEEWEKVGVRIEKLGASREQFERKQNSGAYAEAFFAGDWQQAARDRLAELGQDPENGDYAAAAAAGDFLAAVGIEAPRVTEADRAHLIEYFKRQQPAADRKTARRQAAGAIGLVKEYAVTAPVDLTWRAEDHIERDELLSIIDDARESAEHTKKWDADRAILKERGEREPVHTKQDITTFDGLEAQRGKVVKLTRNDGKTWEYAKLRDQGPEEFEDNLRLYGGGVVRGYSAELQQMPNNPGYASETLTEQDFERGLIVRPTKRRETKGMRFSWRD